MPLTTRPASTSRQAMMRLARRSEGTEVLQDFQASFGGFLWMKLHAEDIVALHGSRKRAAIVCAGRSLVDHRGPERVGVIDKCTAVYAVEQPRSISHL